VKTRWYTLHAAKLHEEAGPVAWPGTGAGQVETWCDIHEADRDELQKLLAPLDLHPLILERCMRPVKVHGTISAGEATVLVFPAEGPGRNATPVYLTFLLQNANLVTIRHGLLPLVDELVGRLLSAGAPPLHHLAELIYLLVDELTDRSVQAQVELRDEVAQTGSRLAQAPGSVAAGDLTALRAQVDRLVSLVENQHYTISGLAAADNKALQEPQRKAYVQDLVSEVEIARQAAYRLENRVNDLHTYYQVVSGDRVEKRLRVLTILSAVTLPLGLITGLLGMNVGGIPGTELRYGFILVLGLMAVVSAVELWYLRRGGWFD
jgi:Mg2+ and Co2+ transporter CorA